MFKKRKSRLARLEQRVSELEQQLREQAKLQQVQWEALAGFKDGIDDRIKHFVAENIYITTLDNREAFEKGEKIKVILRDVKEVLGD